MEKTSKSIQDVKSNLEDLKFALNNRDLYVSQYFSGLKSEIKTAYDAFLQQHVLTSETSLKPQQIYSMISEEIRSSEQRCLSQLGLNRLNKETKCVKKIETDLENLKSSDPLKILAIYNSVQEALLRMKKTVFLNKDLVFFTIGQMAEFQLNIKTFGVLVIIEDEFIDAKEILKNCDLCQFDKIFVPNSYEGSNQKLIILLKSMAQQFKNKSFKCPINRLELDYELGDLESTIKKNEQVLKQIGLI